MDHQISGILLAIDVGSSSVRCIAYRYKGTKYAIDTDPIDGCSSSIQRAGVEPISGFIQTNALVEAIDSTVDDVLSKLRARFENNDEITMKVDAVGFTTFAMNLIAVDERGDLVLLHRSDDNFETQNDSEVPMTNATTTTTGISYACNTPNVYKECQQLRQELGLDALDELYQATGTPLHSAYALPQLRVLYSQNRTTCRSDTYKIHRWQSIAGYCLSRWTSRRHLPMTYSEASWTGLLNVRDCVFEESAIRLLPPDCRAALPELADFTDGVVGIPKFLGNDKTATNPYWTRFPELRTSKFFLGIGDGASANIGSKCTTPSRIAVTIGTSAAARMCLRHQTSSPPMEFPFRIPECRGLFCYRIDRNHVLVGGALTDGGSVVEWASRFLNLDKDKVAFQDCLNQVRELVDAECCGGETTNRHENSTMVPFLSGERSTGFRDGATGAMFGLTRETTPAHFFKSCLEGVSLRLKAVTDLMLIAVDYETIEDRYYKTKNRTNGNTNHDSVKMPVLVASGRAMEVNDIWRQMVADSCGLQVVLDIDTVEGTSRGVARLLTMSLLAQEKVEMMSATFGSADEGEEKMKKISLSFEHYEEELHPFLTSDPRPSATSIYRKKANFQDRFIDSISPLFLPGDE